MTHPTIKKDFEGISIDYFQNSKILYIQSIKKDYTVFFKFFKFFEFNKSK